MADVTESSIAIPASPDQVMAVIADFEKYLLEYEWPTENEVRWHLVSAQLLSAMDGSYVLTPTADGTDVSYRLAVDLRIPMIGLIKRKAEKTIVDRALQGLRARVVG